MRIMMVVAIGLCSLAVVIAPQPAAAGKSKMGCEIGTQVWSASEGKCVPGTAKAKVRAGKSAVKKPKKPE